MTRNVVLAACILGVCAPGCGRYGEFTLPAPGGTPAEIGFRWEPRREPVLGRGAPGEWDSTDALNPSVVRTAAGLLNFYSGFDGRTWHTGLAVSVDGIHWEKQGRVLSPDPNSWEGDDYSAANGSALAAGGRYLYWYQAGRLPRIGLATSPDGRRWSRLPEPVLPAGPRGSWDERGVADPYVIRAGGAFYMFYLGQDRARRQRLGVARSGDGVRWQKLRSNPILDLGPAASFDENGLGEPAVWASHGHYWMLYTGRDRGENRRLGMARSRDGVRWEKLTEAMVFGGNAPWNARVVCDPSVEPSPDSVTVWFGGGDRPSPDENLNGQIGMAVLRPVDANLSE
jgi:predicted GH43/DUF377 family glycosyl hydrolase